MKQIKRFALLSIIGVIAFLGLPFSSMPAQAEEKKSEIAQLLTPTKQTPKLSPGETFRGYFDIHNRGTKAFSFRVYATGHQVSERDYNSIRYDIENNYTMIQHWVTFEHDEYRVEPDQHQRVHYTIKVPTDVPAGGQYATLMSEIVEESEGGTIKNKNRVGMTLIAQIEGTTRGDGHGKITENNLNALFLTPPISASAVVKNNGNIHAEAKSTLTIFSLFSKEPIWTNEDRPLTNLVFPETSRFINIDWKGSPRLGLFRVVHNVKFMGETSQVEKIVFICPFWFLFVILLVITSFIANFIVRKKHRRNN